MLLHADCARLARCRAHAPAPRRPGAGTVPSRATSGARRARERIFRKKKQKDVTVASTRRVQLCVHVCVVCESRTVRTSSASGRTYTSRPHHTGYCLLVTAYTVPYGLYTAGCGPAQHGNQPPRRNSHKRHGYVDCGCAHPGSRPAVCRPTPTLITAKTCTLARCPRRARGTRGTHHRRSR